MFEKVNPSHPDKVADRIAGAIVDLAYKVEDNPKIAVEVLIGHGHCHIITEASITLDTDDVAAVVKRIVGEGMKIDLKQYPQDVHLAENQASGMKAGDNGIFCGVPTSDEEYRLTKELRYFYRNNKSDGKAIVAPCVDTFCLSKTDYRPALTSGTLNPLGYWEGGLDVDTGATNRKLGSDMGQAVTGGGLHGKDLSKADVSVNIWCHMKAEECDSEVKAWCSIGDKIIRYQIAGLDAVMTVGFEECVRVARQYIFEVTGGFEKFAEWGLIR